MNSILNILKKHSPSLPVNIGLMLAHIPFNLRPGIGELYKKQIKNIQEYPLLIESKKKELIYKSFFKVFSHAYSNIPYYTNLYKSIHHIELGDIKSFEDIKAIPLTSKNMLRDIPLEDRSFNIKNRLLVNTGGSSGKPFSFYMDPLRYGNEWAHIHSMWSVHGFKPTALKLNFDGRSSNVKPIHYDFVRNSLIVNIYANFAEIEKQLIEVFIKYKIEYLHGYPSAIYEFTKKCSKSDLLLKYFRVNLKACFLNSEYPSPHYRDKIEKTFKIPTQSFYGHTETCVMAYESLPFEYVPYHTYGFAEAIEFNKQFNLVGTSYFNFASPLIRYNTEDIIKPLNFKNDILDKFTINEGRMADFILDENDNKISLTGLIFGRHHLLFEHVDHIQVQQIEKGKAIIYCITDKELSINSLSDLFDASNVKIDFIFKHLKVPHKTTSGKITLKI